MKPYWIIRGVVFFVVAFFAMGFALMSLWNWLVPDLFHGPFITFGQAVGLFILGRLLFGGFGKHGRHGCRGNWRRRWQEKFEKMTPEQKEEYRKRWGNRCGGRWNMPGEEQAPTV